MQQIVLNTKTKVPLILVGEAQRHPARQLQPVDETTRARSAVHRSNSTEFIDVVVRKSAGSGSGADLWIRRFANYRCVDGGFISHQWQTMRSQWARPTDNQRGFPMNSRETTEVEIGELDRTRDTKRQVMRTSRPTKFGRNYGSRPKQHNGLHRRRRKKLRW